jgi:hypothetical protein
VIRTTPRTAASIKRCDCGRAILPGDRYLEAVASPHHDDLGNPSWWRITECAECAHRHGHSVAATAGSGGHNE